MIEVQEKLNLLSNPLNKEDYKIIAAMINRQFVNSFSEKLSKLENVELIARHYIQFPSNSHPEKITRLLRIVVAWSYHEITDSFSFSVLKVRELDSFAENNFFIEIDDISDGLTRLN